MNEKQVITEAAIEAGARALEEAADDAEALGMATLSPTNLRRRAAASRRQGSPNNNPYRSQA